MAHKNIGCPRDRSKPPWRSKLECRLWDQFALAQTACLGLDAFGRDMPQQLCPAPLLASSPLLTGLPPYRGGKTNRRETAPPRSTQRSRREPLDATAYRRKVRGAFSH